MPQAEIPAEYLSPEKVYDPVLTGQADLGLVSYPESNRDIAAIPWRQEKMMVAAAPRWAGFLEDMDGTAQNAISE